MNDFIECKICHRRLSRITNTHLKIHNLTANAYKARFGNESLYSEFSSKKTSIKLIGRRYTCEKLRGENNPMSHANVKERHRVRTQKSNRPDWKNSLSVSMRGRCFGGALVENRKQVGNKIKDLWKDPESVYRSEEYIQKLLQRQSKKWKYTNEFGEKFPSSGEFRFSLFLRDKKIEYQTHKYIRFRQTWLVPDFFIPQLNLIVEIVGSYGSKLWDKEIRDNEKLEFYQELGYKSINVYPEDFKNFESVFEELDESLKVNEIFYSICGEGTEIGRPAIFIRGSGCNLRCKCCDTEYSFTEGSRKNLREILHSVKQFQVFVDGKREYTTDLVSRRLVFLTGGEITIQSSLLKLILMLKRHNFDILLQTNGTKYDKEIFELCDFISCDVKTPCFGVQSDDSALKEILKLPTEKFQLKFIIRDEKDLEFTRDFVGKFDVSTNTNILLQPFEEDRNFETYSSKLRWLTETVLSDRSWRFSRNLRILYQLHKQIWGMTRRGV